MTDGVPLPVEGRQRVAEGQLTVQSVTTADAGMYRCTAEGRGVHSQAVHVTVAGEGVS